MRLLLPALFTALITLACGPRPKVDAGMPDGGTTDAGPPKSIDEPYSIARIQLSDQMSQQGFRVEHYENRAYTCGKSGYQTFSIVYREGVPLTERHPLWVRMHGGGTGIFKEDRTYLPAGYFPGSIEQESMTRLARYALETGLLAKIRAHPAGFRFLITSMCDHDLYSGVGNEEPNNPFSPDENGARRAADGLLATRAALAFARSQLATSHVFLHGTSAGSIGAFSVAYASERAGDRLSGIVMDSYIMSDRLWDIYATRCYSDFAPEVIPMVQAKVGPISHSEHHPEWVVARGAITVPMLQVWSRGDPSCCGERQIDFTDDAGTRHSMPACDYLHEGLRAAIQARPPGGSSRSFRLCVNAPGSGVPCGMHSPTKIHFAEPTPPGDQELNNDDYNQRMVDWVSARLGEPAP